MVNSITKVLKAFEKKNPFSFLSTLEELRICRLYKFYISLEKTYYELEANNLNNVQFCGLKKDLKIDIAKRKIMLPRLIYNRYLNTDFFVNLDD